MRTNALIFPMLILGSLGTAAIGQETDESPSIWSRIQSQAAEIGSDTKDSAISLFDATKEGAVAASEYVGDRFVVAKEVAAEWTSDQYLSFRSNHPEIASSIDDFISSAGEAGSVVIEKGADGVAVAYEIASDGAKTTMDWTADQLDQLPEIDACTIADYDLLGGVAIGTAGTALAAGATSTTVVQISTLGILTSSGVVPVAGSVVAGTVSAPAIATGVTAAAIVGATIYATSKGICYLMVEPDDELPSQD